MSENRENRIKCRFHKICPNFNQMNFLCYYDEYENYDTHRKICYYEALEKKEADEDEM